MASASPQPDGLPEADPSTRPRRQPPPVSAAMSIVPPPLARRRAAHAVRPDRVRAAFLLALAVLVVGMSLKYAAKTAKPGDAGGQTRSAFLRWRGMINDLFAGTN